MQVNRKFRLSILAVSLVKTRKLASNHNSQPKTLIKSNVSEMMMVPRASDFLGTQQHKNEPTTPSNGQIKKRSKYKKKLTSTNRPKPSNTMSPPAATCSALTARSAF